MSLISTYDLRTWMGTEEGDVSPNAKLDSIIGAVEDFVDSYTNRKLEAQVYRTHQDYCYLDGTGKNYIYLPVTPVSYVSEVSVDSDRVFGSGTLIASADLYWYPKEGKLMSEGGNFIRGRRNVRVDFVAGYAPVVNGTHNSAVSSYPIPYDLKQVMIEMCVESFKMGMIGIRSVVNAEGETNIVQLLNRNSYWSYTLNKYKNPLPGLVGLDE